MTTTIKTTSTKRTVLFGLGIGAALGFLVHGSLGVAHADPAPAPQPRDDRPGPPPGGGGHHGPPPEAIAACNGKAVDAVCSVTFGGKDHAGTCQNGPDGKGELACRPNDMPKPPAGGHPHGPPPEAIQACEGKAESAACSVTHDDHTMEGICRKGPAGKDALHCAPSGPPPAPPQK